jgi:hypothetical protein
MDLLVVKPALGRCSAAGSLDRMIWLSTFFSGLLTHAQLKILPVALQFSIPVLMVVFYNTCRSLLIPVDPAQT